MTLPVTVKDESSTFTQELDLESPFAKVDEVTETVAASVRWRKMAAREED